MGREINSVGVVGGGLMGAGIAEVSAVAGMPVVVRDLPQFLDAARARVEKSLAGAVKHGKMDQAKHDEVLARITFTPDLKDVAGTDIVIEAVPEIVDLKVSLIRELDDLVSPGNVIATNTSSIPIAELAGWSLASEAHHITNPEASGQTAARVMSGALARARGLVGKRSPVALPDDGTPLDPPRREQRPPPPEESSDEPPRAGSSGTCPSAPTACSYRAA